MDRKSFIIAGPCSAESREQVLGTARALADAGLDMFRAGVWKPRTHPGCFEGVGERALEWMVEARQQTGLKICTEVAFKEHVDLCLKYGLDMVWIGARTTANPFLVAELAQALSGTDVPVFVKNPVNADLDLWAGAVERLASAGVKNLGLILRGFSSFGETKYRNNPQWQYAVQMRSRYPGLPFLCDPSHIGGRSEYVHEISQKALDLGFDGLMIESHIDPASALSDADQQLTPEALKDLLVSRLAVRSSDSADRGYQETMARLRAEIDVLDEDILRLLAARMDVSRRIGESKKGSNVAIVQTGRWDELLADMISKGESSGLSADFVSKIFNVIHEASIKAQDEIISGKKAE